MQRLGEAVVLNPLQTPYQMFSSRILIPLYAAANDGIYKISRRKILAKYGPRTILLSLAVSFSALIFFIGLGMIFYPLTYGTLDGVIMVIIGGLSLYLLRKYSKKQKGGIEGDLVVPWSQVRAIVVTNVRQENVANRPSFVLNVISPTYKEIGDWHVLTVDGRDITILDVDDPINKLNYVKVKFNLKF